ncbi:hypothetical protein ERJ75_000424000 [Trypanosoma vivax]|uniref:CID domain-containing protein n=1 Tax=Trypanosoma vivax (strain Y486) TaxID=1055687 RepID=G0U1K5_TRYVY|nr:hypothetical protein TRVL_00984 [Trypanosoma vivax]KAH8616961.1 hypothetical protein ERJ75_000424000 [Trypanosoma vivax]CCC49962.1 conserved hypothetical protein [Trypanosoma vivax Y486]
MDANVSGKSALAVNSSTDFSEELFAVMLESCTPSRYRIEALTQIALRHLSHASDTWTALRKALVRQQELESDENRALWYVLDSLMKHAPHVFVPLISPRLHDYVVQQLPWHLVGVISTIGSGALWCQAMIRTWDGLLPPLLYRSVWSFVVQLQSGRELTNAIGMNDMNDGVQAVDPPATQEQVRQLREAWEVFRSFVGEGAENGGRTPEVTVPVTVAAAPVSVKLEPGLETINVKLEHGNDAGGGGEDDSDVEYIPDFVRGAQHRQLPSASGDDGAGQRPRRAARRRPREED